MSSQVRNGCVPLGTKVITNVSQKCCRTANFNKNLWYRSSVWFLTFLAYMSYHATRKTISVVKTVLDRNCTELNPNRTDDPYWCDWKPFDGPDASTLLATLDSSFLFAYAGAMFISGLIAERVNLRYFLTFGMILSAISCCLMGFAYVYNIHSLSYFIIVQVFGGIFQTTGWPGVVSVMGNWFEKEKRVGLIMGVWNSHTSIGNIVGSLLAGYFVESDWSLSFIVPGILMIVIAVFVFLFLVTSPADVGCTQSTRPESYQKRMPGLGIGSGGYRRVPLAPDSVEAEEDNDVLDNSSSDSDLLSQEEVARRNEGHPILSNNPPEKAVGFFGALCIPGVVEFSLCLFFAKLVSYTFLYWLPKYINSSTKLTASRSAELSTLFDIGGIIGGIIAGMVSDSTGMSATTCGGMLILSIPVLFVYQVYGADTLVINTCLLLLSGALVNGPYALITTAVSAELGTHNSLAGNAKALATVTSIIDGTGSIGAAVGPLLAGLVSNNSSWEYVFYMLMVSDLLAFMLLIRLMYHEIKRWRSQAVLNWNA